MQGYVDAVTLGEAVELSLRSPVPIVEQNQIRMTIMLL